VKTIGLLGGMSWESSALYYRLINEKVKRELGGLHSAKCILLSVDFAEIEQLQVAGHWQQAGILLQEAAKQLEAAGADFLLLCTNTMHRVADAIEESIQIPLLHIADATAQEIKRKNVSSVGLLGTRFTMEQDFYKGKFLGGYGIKVSIPEVADRDVVHRVIYEELCKGVVRAESREHFKEIIEDFSEQGCQGVILGCTEIGMLIDSSCSAIEVFDTTDIHATAAVRKALAGKWLA
jgi:aspartate racemase